MPNKKKSKSVSISCRNEQGYFLIESLLAIALLSVFLIWLGQTYSLWKQEETNNDSLLYQLQHMLTFEAQWSSHMETKNNQLYFHQLNGDIITISLQNNKIRRQVNDQGHEELIRDIKLFKVEESTKSFNILIETNSGEKIEKKFIKKISE